MPIEVYAFKNNNSILLDSSSGGAFTEVVNSIFRLYPSKKVVVYGAAFDEEFNVRHMSASSIDGCKRFRGSKYVQSNLKGVFDDIIYNLKSNNVVVFSGTPCQNKLLSDFLKKGNISDINLFKIDVICHGTPKPQIWKDYVKWLENNNKSKLLEYSFRYKDDKTKNPYTSYAKFKNGKKKINTLDVKLFNRLFLQRLILTEKCFSCNFANINRITDITLGDFWGIEKIMPDFSNENGVSEILVNTDKGKSVIDNIKKFNENNLEIRIKRCFSNEYIKYQNNLNKSADKPINYDKFSNEYKKYGMDYVIKKYAGYTFKNYIKEHLKKIGGKL